VHPFLEWPGPIPFAHRGGAGDHPENTMPAFAHAIELGYTYLETDVHATNDGVLVAFHDPDLSRTCDRPGSIGDLSWREVSSARVDGTEPIPRLDDLLEAFPEARINIDCKADRAVAPLVDALRRHDVLDRVCIGSFSDRRLRRLRAELGERLCSSFGPFQVASLLGAGRVPWGGQVAQVPPRWGRIDVVTERTIRTARRRGFQVHVWTIDEHREMHRLLDLGVDGVMTDRPAVLKSVLEERNAWHT
jgi:glycerophosphoryl diester phosphodiesterase